jgi:D-glycero-alpha-D-manno-heptose-7-phosphate kinase
LRIPLGGGGTDLPAYYSRYGGFLVSAAINRYVYIIVNRRFEDTIRVSYSRTEIVERPEELEHPIVREALRLLGLGSGLEIVSIADLPANTGLGSSSSFTVGLLHALHAFKGESVSPRQLAEEAFHIEAEVLGEPIGWQDMCVAAYGGIVAIEIGKEGAVTVTPVPVADDVVDRLEAEVMLFYTGIKRSAGEMLRDQSQALTQGNEAVIQALHEIKAIGLEVRDALQRGDLLRFGELLHRHWEVKKTMSPKISSDHIDQWYQLARRNGALGGKVMGAGGGGFFMFYVKSEDKARLRDALTAEGLREMRFAVEWDGSKVIINF